MRRTLSALALLVLLSGAFHAAEAQQARHSRPDPDGGPTKVRIAVLVTDVASVDDVAETMTIDFAVLATWSDPRLAWEPIEGVETQTYNLSEVWHPRLNVLNGRDLEASLPIVVDVEPDGTVVLVQRLNGDLALRLDLRAFPLDRQEFTLDVISVRNRPDTVELIVDERSGLLDSAQIPGWSLAMGQPRAGVLQIEETGTGAPRMTWVIEGRREVGYYLWTMVVPLTFIVFMAWTVFWIHPSFLPPMVGVATASAFSLIAYRTALRLSLPKVAYMTRADVFILGATVLVFSALGVAIASNRMVKGENEAGAIKLQRWTRLVYVALFAILIAISLTW